MMFRNYNTNQEIISCIKKNKKSTNNKQLQIKAPKNQEKLHTWL